jgi:chloramphenicol O-acetyltransferase type A
MAWKEIDMATWPRRDHFKLYTGMDFPYFSLTVDVDLTAWLAARRAAGQPFFPSLVHHMTSVANQLENFRTRIRGDKVVLHDQLRPSFAVPWRGDCINFCTVDYEPELEAFLPKCEAAIAFTQAADHLLLDEPGKDELIFLGCLPWFSFTSMTHACNARAGDSFPRISWGKLLSRDGRDLVPVNFQLHHALADGLHVARFIELLERT